MHPLLTKYRRQIIEIGRNHGVVNLRVFGSVARGDDDGDSDIDFLVELEPHRSLFDLGSLQMELESLLGRKIDLVTERGLKSRIRDAVLRDARPL